jgi:RNA polymerase sigma-70 factor (ECF subfamily)
VVAERVQRELQNCLARLFGYAMSLTGDRDLSQDLLQDCALKALGAADAPREAPALRAWLFRILRNAWIDRQRRDRFDPLGDEDDEMALDPTPWQFDQNLIDVITVKQALRRLPPAARDIIALVDLVGFSYAEAAVILGVPVGTVMSRLSRARQRLLSAMADSNLRPLRVKRV